MKKAYILLAHKAPQQLARLIGSLDDGRSDFFIHLDHACDQAPFRRELAGRSGCHFIRRENGGWGQFGIVKATLGGLRALSESSLHFDVIHLLSGQDYPLRSNTYADCFFEMNRGKIFMEFFPLPADFWTNRGLDRIYDYHFGNRRRRSRQTVSKWITRICEASVVFKRRFPRGLKPFGGWQWWSMPMDAVHEILRFVERRPDFPRYHRRSLLPDELFFQTILLNSESDRIRNNLVNNCLRFIDWDNPNPASPAVLTVQYFDTLIASKSLFARKFDEDSHPAILDQLDAHRAEEEKHLQKERASGRFASNFSRSADFPESPASPGTKKGLFEPAILADPAQYAERCVSGLTSSGL